MAITKNTINRKGPGGDGKTTVNFSSSTLNAGGGGVAIADPGAGFAIAVEKITVNYPADDTLTIREDTTTIIGPWTFKVAGQAQYVYQPPQNKGEEGALILTANKELNLLTGGANAISGIIDYHIIAT